MRLRLIALFGITLLFGRAATAQTVTYQQMATVVIKPALTSPTGLGTSFYANAFPGNCNLSFTVTNNNPQIFTVSPTSGSDTGFSLSVGFSGITAGSGTAVIEITSFGGCSGFTAPYYILVNVVSGNPPAPPTGGNTPNTGNGGEPVSSSTGELFGYDETADLILGGPAGLEFRRYYASYLSANGVSSALSTNWMHNFDVTLAINGTTATITLFRGKTVTFSVANSPTVVTSNEQLPYQLQGVAGGILEFLDPRSNLIYAFGPNGKLSTIADRNGNTLTITQGAFGPTQVSDGLGRTLTFTYSNGLLAEVQDQSGRSVSFQYSNGTLVAWTDANGNKTTFAYTMGGALNGLLTTATRPAGNQPFSQVFDPSGRVSTQSDSFSQSMTFNYSSGSTGIVETGGINVTQSNDSNNNLISTSDPSGGVSKFAYDMNNRPTSTTDRLGNVSTATWDPVSGLPSSYTDQLGNKTLYTYAASTNGVFTFYDLSGVQFADGTTIALTRDANGNVTSATDQAGNVWHSTYTANGSLATTTNPAGGVYTFTYNADGTRASVQTPSSDTTKFGYDAVSRPNLITNPDSTTESFQFDAVSNPLKFTDERGNSTAGSFDANNNPKTATDGLGAITSFAFDTDDRPTATTDPLGNALTKVWDKQSRLSSVTNAAGNKVVLSYDNLNRITAVADASGNGFQFGVDQENRLTAVTDALSRTTNYTRDAHGNVIGAATPKMENFSFSYDMLNRPASTTDPLGRMAQFTRESRGLLSAVLLPGGVGAEFARNSLRLITAITDPVDNVWSRAYDNMGRLTSKTDPLNRVSSFTYDSRQRLASATFPIGTAQYAYDAAGNLTSLKYSDGTSLSYTWDADNRLTAATGLSLAYDSDGHITNSNGLQIARDPAGRIASVTYAAGKTVNYTYNNRGLLSQVTDWVGGNTTFTYDNAAELTGLTLATGVTEAYTWDADGRVLTIKATNSGGTALSSITLTRDALGRVTSAARSSANIPAEAPGTAAYAYDAAAQAMGDTFDGLGRLTQDNQRSYTWDLASRLSSYSGGNGSASFTYDALGQRLSRTSSGATQSYVWNYAFPLPVLSTVQSGGTGQTYYVWLPNGTLLNSISAADGTRRFYHFDESGSTVLLTDGTGAVTDTYATSIYGDTVAQTGSTANPFTFQGQFGVMSEGATSLYYMRARYYDSGPARFLSRDPLSSRDPRAVNPYQFAHANPVEQEDASGRLSEAEGQAFAEAFLTGALTLGFDEITRLRSALARSALADKTLGAGKVYDNVFSFSAVPSLADPNSTIPLASNPDDVFVPTEYAPNLETGGVVADTDLEVFLDPALAGPSRPNMTTGTCVVPSQACSASTPAATCPTQNQACCNCTSVITKTVKPQTPLTTPPLSSPVSAAANTPQTPRSLTPEERTGQSIFELLLSYVPLLQP